MAFTRPNLKQFAAELGLNADVFGASLDQGKYTQRVRDETEEARKLGISSTPTFFVGDEKIVGALPFDRFKTAIEAQLR